jgi:hypothetical protein
MPRRLRIEFEGAIDYVMARGNARQKIVRDDADRQRLIEGLEQAVIRYGWELPSYGQSKSTTSTRPARCAASPGPSAGFRTVLGGISRSPTAAVDRPERRAGGVSPLSSRVVAVAHQTEC